jgi:hypothetical protein
MTDIRDILSSAKAALDETIDTYSRALKDDYTGGFRNDYKAMNLSMALKGWQKVDDKAITIEDALDELTSLDVSNTIKGEFGVPDYKQHSLEGLSPSDVIDHIKTEFQPDIERKDRYVEMRFLTYVKGDDIQVRLIVEGGPVHVIIGTKALKADADKWELFEYSPAVRTPNRY